MEHEPKDCMVVQGVWNSKLIFKAKLQAESSVNWFPKKLISQIFKAFCLGDSEISFDIN